MSVLRRNWVDVRGRGEGKQPLVLVHGFGIDQHAWDRVLPALEPNYCVVRYDLTGLGRSDSSGYDHERHGSLHGHADDLLAICRELDLQDALLVGHSAGGMIGVLASLAQPGLFRKLVLLSTSPCYINDTDYVGGFELRQAEEVIRGVASDYVAWCNQVVPMAVGQDASPATTEQVLHGFRRVDPEIAHHFFRVILFSDHRADLPRVSVPTLVVQATRDAFVPLETARYMADHLPRGELHVLRGHGGHFPHLGAPQDVIAAIRDFLAHPLK